MKKVVTLVVLSLLLIFGLASNAFASINVYPDYVSNPAYPTILYTGPSNLNASVMSDSVVERVYFTVFKDSQTEPCLTLEASTSFSGSSWWTTGVGDFDWDAGDYRIETTAVNQLGETANQTGYLKIQAENILRGTVLNWSNIPLKYSTVYFHLPEQDVWTGTAGWTDENGRFAVYGLAAGTYQVSAYQNNQVLNLGTVTVNVDNSVVSVSDVSGSIALNNGKLVITMTKPKVSGRLLRDGVPFDDANITIRKEGSDIESYWVNTDKGGYFGLDLPDGNYIIAEINRYRTPGNMIRIELGQAFTVADSTDLGDVIVPSNNVVGGISGLKTPLEGSPETMYGIFLNFVNKDADDYSPNKYFMTPAKWDSTAGQYTFGIYLPAGNYQVQTYANGQQMDFLGESFVVSGENNTDVSTAQENKLITADSGRLNILVPEDNVTGTLLDANGNPVAYASITMKKAEAAIDDWMAYKYALTDENGRFSLVLEDSSYTVTQVYYGMNSATPNQQFNVSGETEVSIIVP